MVSKQHLDVDGRELAISNLGKVFFPESGFTKGEVIAFYSEIAEVILPHLRDRPLTLKRYPDGVTAEHFYEKNAPKHKPSWVKTFAVPRSEDGSEINYILCNDRANSPLGDESRRHRETCSACVPDLNRSFISDLPLLGALLRTSAKTARVQKRDRQALASAR
jgi:hypothetical protein